MAKDYSHLEDLNTREFYDFYRKTRRKVSQKINQHNLFLKAIGGLIGEMKNCMEDTEHGIHLRGLGVMYKKPFGKWYRKMSLFTHRRGERGKIYFYLEDEYLRSKYIIRIVVKRMKKTLKRNRENKPDAVMLHRKLIKKNGISNT